MWWWLSHGGHESKWDHGSRSSRDRDSWSPVDHGSFAARSSIIRRAIVAHDHLALMAHDHHAIMSINQPFTGSNYPHFSREFLLKNWCYSLLFLTFDQFVRQLSKFEGRSWVHNDSPAFRLDHNLIKVGFVVINHRIRSNFPLKRRTSAEEDTAQIHFNPHELKPHLHGNQVSSEVWSFIWQ